MAEPPLPNIPPRKPTTAPMAMIAEPVHGSSEPAVRSFVQDLITLSSIGCTYGSPPAALRPRGRRRGHVHRRRGGLLRRPAVALAGRRRARARARRGAVRAARPTRGTHMPPARRSCRRPARRCGPSTTLRADVDAVAGRRRRPPRPRRPARRSPSIPVTPLVGAFRRAHPGVVVRLAHPDGTDELLGAGALGRQRARHHRAARARRAASSRRPLLRQELVAVLPPGVGRPGSPATPADLAARPMVTMPVGTSTRDALDAALAGAGADRRPRSRPTSARRSARSCSPAPAPPCCRARWPRSSPPRARSSSPLDPPLWRDIGIVHRTPRLSPPPAPSSTCVDRRTPRIARSRPDLPTGRGDRPLE